MKTIVIANQKGGVGKTTTATSMATILAKKGYRTLLIDADKQCNSTDTYGAVSEGVTTLYDVLLEKKPAPISEAIQETKVGKIVASDLLLIDAEKILNSDVNAIFKLSDALSKVENDFDYVVIDTAPSIDIIMNNCLIAADYVVIPVTASRYAALGLSQLYEAILAIRQRLNTRLKVAGLLLVKYNAQTILSRETKESLDEVAEQMETKLFKSTIRTTVRVEEAQALKTSLIDYDPKCTAAQDYLAFVEEFLEGEE